MLRKKAAEAVKNHFDSIRWRGHEVTRIEAFSDAVFAFGVTLLIVALEVPKNYDELMEGMASFIPFAICFAIIVQIWHTQNLFFRRYGLHDVWTIVLNGVLLFTVLFFVYPLKFLFSNMFVANGHAHEIPNNHQMANLIIIYSGGYSVIFLLFGLMYFNAWKKTDILELSDEEAFETRTYMYRNFLVAALIGLSVVNAMVSQEYLPLSWIPYMLIGVVIALVHKIRGKMQRRMFEERVPDDVAFRVTPESPVPNDDVE